MQRADHREVPYLTKAYNQRTDSLRSLLIFFKDMDIRFFRVHFKLIDESREFFPVKLVVAQNIKPELGEKSFGVRLPFLVGCHSFANLGLIVLRL